MPSLTQRERQCVDRFYALLEKRFGERLVEVRMFGADIDLLVVTTDEPSATEQEELIDETYPMSLECGRQISPHFFSQRKLKMPDDEGTRDFLRRVSADAVTEWPARPASSAPASVK